LATNRLFLLDTNGATLFALSKTKKSVRGYYHVSSRSITKIMKRIEEIRCINAVTVYGHKINGLLLISVPSKIFVSRLVSKSAVNIKRNLGALCIFY